MSSIIVQILKSCGLEIVNQSREEIMCTQIPVNWSKHGRQELVFPSEIHNEMLCGSGQPGQVLQRKKSAVAHSCAPPHNIAYISILLDLFPFLPGHPLTFAVIDLPLVAESVNSQVPTSC